MIFETKLYGKIIYYSTNDVLVCYKIEGDIFKRYCNLKWFEDNILQPYNNDIIQSLNIRELKIMKKTKIWNKDNKYIGIDKESGRIFYYDKLMYQILNNRGNINKPVAFYLPKMDLDFLLDLHDGNMFSVANSIYKNCNTKDIEMDLDTLYWILCRVKDFTKQIGGFFMKQVIDILKEIKNTKGTNDKMAILLTKKSNKLLLEVLKVLYSPLIATKIASKKMDKVIHSENAPKPFSSDRELLCWLENRCTGKDSDILKIQHYISQFDEDEQEILKEIVCQSLSIGLDYKNINKALGYRFIDILEPMLSYALANRIDKVNKSTKFSASRKLDGHRMLIKKVDGKLTAFSRNGLLAEGIEDFLEEINSNLPFDNMIYDGEILTQKVYPTAVEGYTAVTKLMRTKGNKNKNEMCFHCFDCVPYDEFIEGKSKLPYSQRRLTHIDKVIESDYIKIVKSLGIYTIEDKGLYQLLDTMVENGEEGLMINDLEGYYETKRSTSILKMKKFYTVDLKCIGVEQGTGNFTDMLGSIICNYKGFELNVGSGFTQKQREYYWRNSSEIIDKIVEVKFMEETQNQQGGVSLRFPIFLQVREDKSEESYE